MNGKLLLAMTASTALLFPFISSSFSQGIEKADLPILHNTVTTDESGTAELPGEGLIDFMIPAEIDGTAVKSIASGAFEACNLFRTVTIPKEITTIGSDAFADCSNLEAIIMEGRCDASDMLLGHNWSGDADIRYEYILREDEQVMQEESTPSDPVDIQGSMPDPDNLLEPADGEVIKTTDIIDPPAHSANGEEDVPTAEPTVRAEDVDDALTVPEDQTAQEADPQAQAGQDTEHTESIQETGGGE